MRSSITRCDVRFAIALALASVPVASASAIASSSTITAAQASSALSSQQPENWLTDAEGRTYRLEPLPKSQGVKIDEQHVRTIWGVQADLAREDEQFFYIKLYKVAPAPPAPKPAARAARTPPPEPVAAPSQRLRWTAYSDGLPTGGQWREGLALADVSKSGHLDIVVSPARKTLRPPSIFAHDASGWKRVPALQFPSRPYDYGAIAVGDLTGDGMPDVVLSEHLKGMIALQGKGGGQFEDASGGLPFQERSDTPVFSSQAIVLADCNGDGKPDILALGEGPRLPTAAKADYAMSTGIASFTRQADGTWSRKEAPASPTVFGSALASGDIDGDGKVDLVIAPGTLGDSRILFRGDGACGWQGEESDAVRTRSYITSVAAGKLAGAERDAVVLGYTDFGTDQPSFGIDLLTRDGEGHWTRKALVREPGRGRIEALATGDLDGDGKLDIAAVDREGQVIVLLGDGHGRFTREQQSVGSATHCGGAGIAIGDLDGDGLGDLVVSFAQEASPMNPGVCPSEGALMAWKTAKAGATGATAPAAKAPAPKAPATARPKGSAPIGTKHQ
jgi:hypothetical protein